MATSNWIGGTTAVAQVDTLTPGGTIEIGDLFVVTMEAERRATTYALSVAATGTTVNQTCIDIVTAWNASTHKLCTPITAGYVGTAGSYTAVTLTADVAGVPFYSSVSTTEAGGGAADDQTFARATTTDNAGPNDWYTAANWEAGTLPQPDDNLVIDNGAQSILYGLDQSSVGYGVVTIGQSFISPGQVGSIDLPLLLQCDILIVGSHAGSLEPVGSPLIRIELSGTPSVFIYNSAFAGLGYRSPIELTGAAGNVHVYKGKVAFAPMAGETWTCTAAYFGYVSVQDEDCEIKGGQAAAFPVLNVSGGVVSVQNSPEVVNIDGGELTLSGANDIDTIVVNGGTLNLDNANLIGTYTINGGTAYLNKHGVMTLANLYGGYTNWLKLRTARTVTSTNYSAGARFAFDPATLTQTNKPVAVGRVDVTVSVPV